MVAQLRLTHLERVPLPVDTWWTHPQFSSDGRSIFVTSVQFDGIWEYALQSRQLRQVTADKGAGLIYRMTSDGSQIVYRRNVAATPQDPRMFEVVAVRRSGELPIILARGADVESPQAYIAANHSLLKTGTTISSATLGPVIIGIEDTKIALQMDGQRRTFDPLGRGSYIWPSLSPDGKRLLAYDMTRGAFVSDLNGAGIVMLGRRDAPTWTRDGRWIIAMADEDDGQQILKSEIIFVAPDGATSGTLTNSPDIIELFPSCSPTENKILCSTPAGEVFLLTYEEGRQ